MQGEPSFQQFKKPTSKNKQPTDFATPNSNQPIQGLSADMGGVLINTETDSNIISAFNGFISHQNRNDNEIFLHDIEVFLESCDSHELETLEMYVSEVIKDNKSKRFGKRLQKVMPTFSKWAKAGMNLVDQHLDDNRLGNKLADLIEIAKQKYQAAEQKYKQEGKKSDERRAKFTKEFERIIADFKKAEELERNWIKAKKEKANNLEKTTNQNPKLREYLALGFGGYIVALSLMMTGNIKGVKSFEEFIQDTINPTPTLIDVIKEAEEEKQFVPPKVELENTHLSVELQVMQTMINGDLAKIDSNLRLAISSLDGVYYYMIDQKDYERFMTEIESIRAKAIKIAQRIVEIENSRKAVGTQVLLDELWKCQQKSQTLLNFVKNPTNPTNSFDTYSKINKNSSKAEINLRGRFYSDVTNFKKELYALQYNGVINNKTLFKFDKSIGILFDLARYGSEEDFKQAQKDLLKLTEKLQETKYQKR